MITIRPVDDLERDIWLSLLEIAANRNDGWTLVGAQMTALHGYERDRVPSRVSTDADVLVDCRITPTGVGEFSRYLEDSGYELEGVSAEGIGHRFRRDHVTIDILAPDGVGPRADLSTIPPARTVSVPGGSQALRRTSRVDVKVEDRSGSVPRPDLLGAILIKAKAVDVDDQPDAQRRDLLFLASLVEDPLALRAEMRDAEARWIARRNELVDRSHSAWTILSRTQADAAYAVLTLLRS